MAQYRNSLFFLRSRIEKVMNKLDREWKNYRRILLGAEKQEFHLELPKKDKRAAENAFIITCA